LNEWSVPDPLQQARILQLRQDWAQILAMLPELLPQSKPLDLVIKAGQAFSLECQELLVSLALEPFGDLIDGLCECMGTGPVLPLDPRMALSDLRAAIARDCAWALDIDFSNDAANAQFWYVSEEKMEPRLGLRHEEPGGELESPLDIARQIQALDAALDGAEGALGPFLCANPDLRNAARRVQLLASHPYAEIRDNLIGEDCKPIDMLRCKLSFFGAAKFDPKSDRWTRITLAQGAPLWDELQDADDWWLPVFAS